MDVPSSLVYFYPRSLGKQILERKVNIFYNKSCRLLPLHTVNPEDSGVPEQIRCTMEKVLPTTSIIHLITIFMRVLTSLTITAARQVRDEGVYLLENGIHVLLFVGLAADPQWIQVRLDF